MVQDRQESTFQIHQRCPNNIGTLRMIMAKTEGPFSPTKPDQSRKPTIRTALLLNRSPKIAERSRTKPDLAYICLQVNVTIVDIYFASK